MVRQMDIPLGIGTVHSLVLTRVHLLVASLARKLVLEMEMYGADWKAER